jgi:hypothetical protein
MDLGEIDCEVDGTISVSCPVVCFGVSGVELTGSATRVS